MTNERSVSELGARVKDALHAAASSVTGNDSAPTAEHFVRRGVPPRWQWPAVALAAAVAVSLAVAVPYGLLNGGKVRPLPVQSPTTDDPPPLTKAEVKPVGKYTISLSGDVPPATGGLHAVLWENGAVEEDPVRLPGQAWSSVTGTQDGETFYLSRHERERTCTSELVEVTVDDDGKPVLTPLPQTRMAGRAFTDLTVSPDGTSVAMGIQPLSWTDSPGFCETSRIQPDLVIVELASGVRRTWTQERESRDGSSGSNVLAWSFDGKSIAFPWPIHDDLQRGTPEPDPAFRTLEVTAPEGSIEARSTAVPRDDAFPIKAGSRVELVTSRQGSYPPELAAYLPQGGARVLVGVNEPGSGKPPAFVEISLRSGKIREVPR
jgi:hypothetical protein